MNTIEIITIAVVLFSTIILANVFSIKLAINKAVKKFIKPKIRDNGLEFINYKWLGFFNHGDFKDDKFVLVPGSRTGSPVITIYIDVYYRKGSINDKITVKIDAFFIAILKVLYSREF